VLRVSQRWEQTRRKKVIRKGQTVVATVVLAVALGLVVLPFSAARGADDDIAKLIAEAKTASDHERIAAYYENEAKEAKVHVDKHKFESMAYEKNVEGIVTPQFTMKSAWNHCQKLIREYTEVMENATYLAKYHRAAAAALQSKSEAGQK
jgi:maltooligosyltrehalose synthase